MQHLAISFYGLAVRPAAKWSWGSVFQICYAGAASNVPPVVILPPLLSPKDGYSLMFW